MVFIVRVPDHPIIGSVTYNVTITVEWNDLAGRHFNTSTKESFSVMGLGETEINITKELQRLSNLFAFVLRGIKELLSRSSLKNPGEVAWIEDLLYYLATPGGTAEPHLYINLYAAAILEFSIENKDLLELSDKARAISASL